MSSSCVNAKVHDYEHIERFCSFLPLVHVQNVKMSIECFKQSLYAVSPQQQPFRVVGVTRVWKRLKKRVIWRWDDVLGCAEINAMRLSVDSLLEKALDKS